MRLKTLLKAHIFVICSLLTANVLSVSAADSDRETSEWKAGFAKTVITPDEFMWMSGYGGRDRPAEGKVHDLYARAAVIQDLAGHRAVVIATDLIGVPIKMVREVGTILQQRHGIERADIMFTCSHTHCGPALDDKLSHMLAMNDADWRQVHNYQRQLNAKLVELIDRAIGDLQPAALSAGDGVCRFAVNRRAPIGVGPYDHSVPVLRITSPDGSKLHGVIFGYACHNTTLSFYKWCGDYAGFAALYLEDRYPESTALFFAGCGGDQNPLPRRTVELAEKYGRMLAVAVEQVVDSQTTPVTGRLRTAFRDIDLEFDRLPSEIEIAEQLQSGSRYERARAKLLLQQIDTAGRLEMSHSYPVQVWQLGDQRTWVALGGEVVVDYALRLKRELGADSIWVAGYANHVMGYIPSERVLTEGGYEGASSMVVYQLPSPWKAGLEEQIVATVLELVHQLRSGDEPSSPRAEIN